MLRAIFNFETGSGFRASCLGVLAWVAFGLVWFAHPVAAAPVTYELDQAESVVGFTYYFNENGTVGKMPVETAELSLDLKDVSRSTIDVTLRPDRARAGFLFATEALKGAQVLDVRAHPTIRFVAREITGTVHSARVVGDLTVRGVSRPVALAAQLFRQRGTDAGELDQLSILLTGSLDRHDFGASGYADLVGPTIDLRILARINRSE
ncbi:YceI family protein [Shimia sp. R10_1]|uniref:YceI family protein n=1 Tax=Shimia sp. R10_1 TaxID=2821095 RepID=UPI001ADA4213|nr:YceI family protein [Shimia sp. R10_1]MBO9474150.1 YceI family protein [Shimia sp. R10_1]